MSTSGRVVMVSHRAPVEVIPEGAGRRMTRTVGGLATALTDALRGHGGTWVAWAGEAAPQVLAPEVTGLAFPIRAVPLDKHEIDNYYAGFANQVLWPLCHIFPDRCHFKPAFWESYQHANERFAEAVRAEIHSGDLVWVNAFHLCLLPGLLRAKVEIVPPHEVPAVDLGADRLGETFVGVLVRLPEGGLEVTAVGKDVTKGPEDLVGEAGVVIVDLVLVERHGPDREREARDLGREDPGSGLARPGHPRAPGHPQRVGEGGREAPYGARHALPRALGDHFHRCAVRHHHHPARRAHRPPPCRAGLETSTTWGGGTP